MSLTRAELGAAAMLAGLAAFQVALAAGAPWGRAAYGGTHPGALPARLRVTSGVAAVAYGGAAALTVRGSGSLEARSRAFTGLTGLMALGTLANGASRSPVERAVWTPFTIALGVLAWRARSAR